MVCVYAWISASTRSILIGQVSSFFFYVIAGPKSVFLLGLCVFVLFRIFDFLKEIRDFLKEIEIQERKIISSSCNTFLRIFRQKCACTLHKVA